jgi:ketosteroid isomerase-like protein/TolB-like protein
MSDIFISYDREDLPRTRLFADALAAEGWSVWWDRSIFGGQNFAEEIEKALDEARCVVVLWSKNSVDSNWVKTEAAEAADRDILVPALIDDVRIPLRFRPYHTERLVDWDGNPAHEDFRRLVAAIAKKVGREPGEGVRQVQTPVAPPPPPPWPRWRTPLLLALALVAAVGIGVEIERRFRTQPIVVGVMEINVRGDVPVWMCDFTRDGLNTVLSKLPPLRVYSRQKIDLLQRKRNLSAMEAAEELGIAMMISGTLAPAADHGLVLDIEVVDGASGLLVETTRVPGRRSELVKLQNKAAEELIRLLRVNVSPGQIHEILAARTDADLEGYKLLTESMGGFVDEEEPAPAPSPKPPAPDASSFLSWPAPAWATDGKDEAALRDLLEKYRVALEAKDVTQVAALYVEMTPQTRDALGRYFETADELSIRFSKFDILIEGDEAVATFTRNDDFKDTRSGREMHLEVRVSSIVSKQGTDWKIRGLRKPS